MYLLLQTVHRLGVGIAHAMITNEKLLALTIVSLSPMKENYYYGNRVNNARIVGNDNNNNNSNNNKAESGDIVSKLITKFAVNAITLSNLVADERTLLKKSKLTPVNLTESLIVDEWYTLLCRLGKSN